MPDQVKILSKTRGFSGFNTVDVLQLQHEQFAGGLGKPIQREVIDRGRAAAIIPYDPWADRIILIEQFRVGAYAAGLAPWQVEVVAGRYGENETPEQVVRREAVEEIGRPVDLVEFLCAYLINPASTTEHMSLFIGRVDASDAEGVHGLEHEGEDIRAFSLPADEAIGWIGTEKLSNATLLIAMQSFAIHRARLREQWRAVPKGAK